MNEASKDGLVLALPAAWRVVDSAWLHSWLAFCHYNKTQRAPGPMRNDDLLYYDEEARIFKGKTSLVPASKERTADVRATRPRRRRAAALADRRLLECLPQGRGHYRHVREATWRAIVQLYPGSGPEIVVVGPPFDVRRWRVDQGFMKLLGEHRVPLPPRPPPSDAPALGAPANALAATKRHDAV
ncbi:hypothetical protein M885DRAFT_5040 [Pelagophyceae sp. CCMP2097]|nr:hypothetical protein M885DRAFT_5040 [Pelagophyceae sp. CCMP2097]